MLRDLSGPSPNLGHGISKRRIPGIFPTRIHRFLESLSNRSASLTNKSLILKVFLVPSKPVRSWRKTHEKKIQSLSLLIALATPTTMSLADETGDAAAEMARKLQDPLANIKVLMTDNDISGAERNGYSAMLIGFVG
jgi:hypothetical protein